MRIKIASLVLIAVILPSPVRAEVSSGRGDTISYKNEKRVLIKDTPEQATAKRLKRVGAYKQPLYYGVLSYGGNGWCVSRKRTTDAKLQLAQQRQFDLAIESLIQQGQTFDPACLNPANLKSANPQTMSREQAVDLFWATQVTLPSPTPVITPDISVTGLRTHLTIQGSAPATFTLPDPLSPEPIVIEATPVYEISWGDGNVDTTTGNGGPASDLYNVYRDLGFYEVVVTAHWEAIWRVGPNGAVQGELSGLETSGTIPRFQVDEIQAVEQPNPSR